MVSNHEAKLEQYNTCMLSRFVGSACRFFVCFRCRRFIYQAILQKEFLLTKHAMGIRYLEFLKVAEQEFHGGFATQCSCWHQVGIAAAA